MSDWNTTEGWNSGFNGAASGALGGFEAAGPLGAVVGGLGGLVGGLFGHKKSTDWNKKSFNEQVRQFNVMDDFNKNQVQYRVKDALAAGINPLAALGVSSNYSPTISGGGYSSGGESGGFNNFLTSMSKIFNKQEQESRDLDLEAKRIRNRIAMEELNLLRSPGTPSGNQSMEQPPMGTDSLLFRFTYDIEGRPRLMVNQDVTENDADNAGYRSSLAAALASGQINPVTGRVSSRQLRMKLADDYYRATGRRLTNEDEMYISPTELGLVALDEIRGRN